jgi:uncharacterized protein (DUF4415 family)
MSDVKDELEQMYRAGMASRPEEGKEYPRGTGWEHIERRRAERVAAPKARVTARFDEDVVEEFKELAGEGSYQALMNHALRQWLEARSVTQMVREELRSELDELKKSLKAS